MNIIANSEKPIAGCMLLDCSPNGTGLAHAKARTYLRGGDQEIYKVDFTATTDSKSLSMLSGAASLFAEGEAAAGQDSPVPAISMDDIVRNGDILYVRLPADSQLASEIAQVLSSELDNLLARLRGTPGGEDLARNFEVLEWLN